MEFGKLFEIEHVDWSLPPTDPRSFSSLRNQESSGQTSFFLGTPSWGHPEWKGKIYPQKSPAAQFLSHYSRAYQCIELNTVHYRIPTEDQLKKWLAMVPEHFRFCPKIYKGLSHSPGGLQDAGLLKAWLESLPHYGPHLGPCFLQLPPSFDYSHKAALFHFLQNWPPEFELAIEFRHASWFTPGRSLLPALFDYLAGKGIGLVITDVAGRRDLVHGSVTTDFTMLRFIGNDLHPSDLSRSQEWARRLSEWQDGGLHRCYFFVHQPDDVKAPEMTEIVIQDLNEICGASLPSLPDYSSPLQESLMGASSPHPTKMRPESPGFSPSR